MGGGGFYVKLTVFLAGGKAVTKLIFPNKMDKRKLIKHGPSSLTLALPRKWLNERNLNKGDSLFVNTEGNKLILSTEETVNIGKISVNVTNLDRTSLLLYIQSLYRFGYDEIEVHFDKPSTKHYRKKKETSISSTIHKIVNRLIGAEIIQESQNRILIKYITKEAEEDFKAVLRRAFLLTKEAAESLLNGIETKNNSILESIEEKHDNINKFVSYCLRLLNKYGHPDVKKTSYFFHIIASLDKLVDILKYNARDAFFYSKKFSKTTLEIWEMINKSIQLYYELFYKFDNNTINQLSENRDEVKFQIKNNIKKIPNEELILLTAQKQILELILDLTDFRMGLEY